MRQHLGCRMILTVVLSLGSSTASFAGPFEDGLAAFQRGDHATALQLWRPLAEQGNADAQLQVGQMYEGGAVVARDLDEAVRWIRLAAEQGHAFAQWRLGVFYSEALGVPQDNIEAVKWFRLSAEQGLGFAQWSLGNMYAEGQGVPKNYGRAYMWYSLALSSLSSIRGAANYNRDMISRQMTPQQIAEAETMARTCQAANYKQCD